MKDLVFEKKTDKSLDEAIESLKENLKKYSFGVLWELNFKDKIQEKGLEFIDDFVVLEVCNPQQAKDVLDTNAHVGYLLPCKMVVRTNNNQTYIGLTNPERLIAFFDDANLDKVATSIKADLKNAIIDSI